MAQGHTKDGARWGVTLWKGSAYDAPSPNTSSCPSCVPKREDTRQSGSPSTWRAPAGTQGRVTGCLPPKSAHECASQCLPEGRSSQPLGLVEVALHDLISAMQPSNFICPAFASRLGLPAVPSRTLSTRRPSRRTVAAKTSPFELLDQFAFLLNLTHCRRQRFFTRLRVLTVMSDRNLLLVKRILQFAPFAERPARPTRGTRKALTEIRLHLFELLQYLCVRFQVINGAVDESLMMTCRFLVPEDQHKRSARKHEGLASQSGLTPPHSEAHPQTARQSAVALVQRSPPRFLPRFVERYQ